MILEIPSFLFKIIVQDNQKIQLEIGYKKKNLDKQKSIRKDTDNHKNRLRER